MVWRTRVIWPGAAARAIRGRRRCRAAAAGTRPHRGSTGTSVVYSPRVRRRQRERHKKLVESDHLLHAHHGFANAVAIFQVSIALGAVAALTRSRVVWLGSLVLGIGGVVLLGVTLLL